MPRPVLIDTDAGVDDALALILAFRSPELSVKAITTVAGNVEVEKCTTNVLRILNLLQVRETVVVAQGAKSPLRKKLFTALEVHGRDGFGNVGTKWKPVSKRSHTRIDAVETILTFCRRYGKKGTIVALGPLTNIARAMKKNTAALKNIGSLVTMGGAFRVPGNTGPVAEFNYYVDPEAAHIVLNSGAPVTVVPLDLTEQIVLMRREVEYRAARRASPVAAAVKDFTRFYMQYHKTKDGFFGGYVHDPTAVAAVIEPKLFWTRRVHIDVEATGEWTRGMTVADFRRTPRFGIPAVQVAFKVDRERFLKLFHERIWK